MITLQVFVDELGRFGNPVGVVADFDFKIAEQKRQRIAANSGLSELVYVDSLLPPKISIYTPLTQIPFAGHAVVGTTYYLKDRLHKEVDSLWSMGQKLEVWTDASYIWTKVLPNLLPKWNLVRARNVEEIDKLSTVTTQSWKHTLIWAYINPDVGVVRARTFAPDWGIPEDEANGSGAMCLALALRRNLTLQHGQGSVIHVKWIHDASVAVGGSVRDLTSKGVS